MARADSAPTSTLPATSASGTVRRKAKLSSRYSTVTSSVLATTARGMVRSGSTISPAMYPAAFQPVKANDTYTRLTAYGADSTSRTAAPPVSPMSSGTGRAKVSPATTNAATRHSCVAVMPIWKRLAVCSPARCTATTTASMPSDARRGSTGMIADR